MGAMHSGPNPGGDPPVNAALGPSWWYGIGPFMEQQCWYDSIDVNAECGGPAKHQFCANDIGTRNDQPGSPGYREQLQGR